MLISCFSSLFLFTIIIFAFSTHVENLTFQNVFENNGIIIMALHLIFFHPLATICVRSFNDPMAVPYILTRRSYSRKHVVFLY